MANFTHLKYNDPAPDIKMQIASGEFIQLSSLWKETPVLLAFTRHFGCLQCKMMLADLIGARSEIEQAGLRIAVVTQGKPEESREFCEQYAPGILCLADPEHAAYRAFGLERGSVWQVLLSPQVLRGTARARARGLSAQLPPPGQDVMQMSGTFIIGADGRIRLPFYYDTIADHPPMELLLRGVLSTNWDQPFDRPLA